MKVFDCAVGVLTYKKQSEEFLKQSQIPYTIYRYGVLIDGPHTNTDIANLIKWRLGNVKVGIKLSLKDDLIGETSR